MHDFIPMIARVAIRKAAAVYCVGNTFWTGTLPLPRPRDARHIRLWYCNLLWFDRPMMRQEDEAGHPFNGGVCRQA